MEKILAISGGVDSMVMLDILTRQACVKHEDDEDLYHGANNAKNDYSFGDIIVAHFDHGIRDNSGEDAEFVKKVAEEVYHMRYIDSKGNLKSDASEEDAREARYEFLRGVAQKNNGKIYTAHHLDDLVETVAINLIRGTGWRGLACLDAENIERPLLEAENLYEPMDKLAIYEYAAKRGLRFREDQTNSSNKYLRNRVREALAEENDDHREMEWEEKMRIWQLWQEQKKLKREINKIVVSLLPAEGEKWQRKWFRELDVDEWGQKVARELLWAGLLRAGVRATRPQIEDFRQAILNYRPGKFFNLPGDKLIRLGKLDFEL